MSYAICVESSHKKGMGHLFRMLNFIDFLEDNDEACHLFINNDLKSIKWLQSKNKIFQIVDYEDFHSDWESEIIKKNDIKYWINDRLDTLTEHSNFIIKNNVKLVTFDDQGLGGCLANLNICAMPCLHDVTKGKKVLAGIDYIILNPDINLYRRQRKEINKIIVTLGGSDTYGVTIKVANILKMLNKKATIIIGPSFAHEEHLENISNGFFEIKNSVDNLIKEFSNYDLAITGGGVTPFEANASGLPCIIVANEQHEIENANFLDKLGSSIFAGFYENINNFPNIDELGILKLSSRGLERLNSNGCANIYDEIKNL